MLALLIGSVSRSASRYVPGYTCFTGPALRFTPAAFRDFLRRRSQRAIQVRQNVVDVLDADAQANHVWGNVGAQEFRL